MVTGGHEKLGGGVRSYAKASKSRGTAAKTRASVAQVIAPSVTAVCVCRAQW